jgi:hypothetical protein
LCFFQPLELSRWAIVRWANHDSYEGGDSDIKGLEWTNRDVRERYGSLWGIFLVPPIVSKDHLDIPPGFLRLQLIPMIRIERAISFGCAILCALSAGTAYLVSIYSTQLADRFGYNTYEINAITMSGNYGNYLMGLPWGMIADRNSKNPGYIFLVAAICLVLLAKVNSGQSLGYSLVAASYSGLVPKPASYLVLCVYFFLIGFGSAASFTASMLILSYNLAMSTNIRNWKRIYHGVAVGIPVSMYGLSAAIFSIIAKTFFYHEESGLDVTSLLILIAIVTFLSNFIAIFGLRDCRDLDDEGEEEEEPLLADEDNELEAAEETDDELKDDDHNVSCFRYTESYALAFILFTIGGCGLMYINNIGNIILALSKGDSSSPKIQDLQVLFLFLPFGIANPRCDNKRLVVFWSNSTWIIL